MPREFRSRGEHDAGRDNPSAIFITTRTLRIGLQADLRYGFVASYNLYALMRIRHAVQAHQVAYL